MTLGRRNRRREGRRRRGPLVALLVIVALADSATLAGAAVLHARYLERTSQTNAVTAPELDGVDRTGRFETTIEYAALFSGEGHQVSSDVVWDDEWFFEDPTEYNHDLAHTCAVLSAVANAESAYYQQGSTVPAYAEQAFADLGFDEVCTASYRYRSEVLDEVIGILDGTDVVAYTLATKRITSAETGEERELCVVVVRGSYGSEWLSNVRIEDEEGVSGGDHLGFTLAAQEIVADLEARAAELEPGVERSYLFCGHSRGAAVAALLGSYADGAGESEALATAANVRAYGFATPNCTSDENARAARYDNIFNVLNPADAVPMLPSATWGYDRYGQDVWLPALDDGALSDAMRASYLETMGAECPCKPEDRALAQSFANEIASIASSTDELVTPLGLARATAACVSHDAMQLLTNHYPNTYIAWLEITTAADLTLS